MAEVQLGEYLEAAAKRRFDWASCNCLTVVADWIVTKTGTDPFARYRYVASKSEARRVIRKAGGDVAFVSRCLGRFAETQAPRAGDVVMVRGPGRGGKERLAGAICVAEGKFAVLTVDLGLVIAPMVVAKAWAIDG